MLLKWDKLPACRSRTDRQDAYPTGSDAENAIDEVVTRGFYGALPLSYGAAIEKQLRRWDSNPRHPAPEACTPNRQSIVCSAVVLKTADEVCESEILFDALPN